MGLSSIKSDIVIIGGGISSLGVVLALNEIGEKKIIVVRDLPGFTAIAGGNFNFILHRREEEQKRTVDIIYEEFGRILTPKEITDALNRLVGFLDLYEFLWESPPFLVVNDKGKTNSVPLKPKQKFDLREVKKELIVVIDLWGLIHIKASHICNRMNQRGKFLGKNYKFVPVRIDFFKRRSDPLMKLVEVGRLLELQDAFERFFFTLKEGLKDYEERCGGVILPPILGVEGWREVYKKLKERVAIPVGEVYSSDGEIEAKRFETEFEERFKEEVEIIEGNVKQIRYNGRNIEEIVLEDGTIVKGEFFVMATGGFLGGGIVVKDGTIKEPLLNLDLNITPLSGYYFNYNDSTLWEGDFFGNHPIFNIGVKINNQFQPLKGNVRSFDNLWATGSLISLPLKRVAPSLTLDYLTGWKVGTIIGQVIKRSQTEV